MEIIIKEKKRRPVALIGYKSGIDSITQTADELGVEIVGIYDKYFYGNTNDWMGIPFIGDEEKIDPVASKHLDFFISGSYSGVGNYENPEHNGLALRLKRIQIVKEKELSLCNFICPTSYIHPTVKLGQGIMIADQCSIRGWTTIGDFTMIEHMTCTGHHCTIGENCVFSPMVFFSGFINFGNNVYMGAHSTAVTSYSDRKMSIGDNVKIHAGAVVYKDVEPNKTITCVGKVMKNIDLEQARDQYN